MTRAWLIVLAAILVVLLVWLGIVVRKVESRPSSAGGVEPTRAGNQGLLLDGGAPSATCPPDNMPAGTKLGRGRVPSACGQEGLYPGGPLIEKAKQAGRAAEAGVSMRPGGSVADAIRAARRDCATGDRLVVFGSFHTVGPALGLLRA